MSEILKIDGDSSPKAIKKRMRESSRTAARLKLESQFRQSGGRVGPKTKERFAKDDVIADVEDMLRNE